MLYGKYLKIISGVLLSSRRLCFLDNTDIGYIVSIDVQMGYYDMTAPRRDSITVGQRLFLLWGLAAFCFSSVFSAFFTDPAVIGDKCTSNPFFSADGAMAGGGLGREMPDNCSPELRLLEEKERSADSCLLLPSASVPAPIIIQSESISWPSGILAGIFPIDKKLSFLLTVKLIR
ncbi:MAG: hypothetical protein JXR97_07045 [Planctomycetes bacterium]|nr:hypothetical protein [Planctomycetota bacterium]